MIVNYQPPSEKRHYKFKLPTGEEFETTETLKLFKIDPELLKEVIDNEVKFYSAQEPNEKAWRNKELQDTDWMLMPDVVVEHLDEVIKYRQALRDYRYTTSEPRPVKGF